MKCDIPVRRRSDCGDGSGVVEAQQGSRPVFQEAPRSDRIRLPGRLYSEQGEDGEKVLEADTTEKPRELRRSPP